MERAAEWSRAPALANPSVMRVGSKLGSKPDIHVAGTSKLVMFLFLFVNSGFTIVISWLQAPCFGDWNEGT